MGDEGQRPLTLRRATAADQAAVATLLEALGYPVEPSEVPGRLAAVEAGGGVAMLVVDGESALGLVAVSAHPVLHASGPVGYIGALVVAPHARSRGVGRLLVSAAEEWARARGCVRLSLTSAEHRADAHQFYPRCGLPYTGRRYSRAL